MYLSDQMPMSFRVPTGSIKARALAKERIGERERLEWEANLLLMPVMERAAGGLKLSAGLEES